jgi:hypothetical protein
MLLVVVAGCGDSVSPTATPGIRIVSGSDIADSANAVLGSPLIVEVHDSTGALVPTGTSVRFTAVTTPRTEALVRNSTSPTFATFTTTTTDANGRAAVTVKLGATAGSARLAVAVLTYGLEDTARYTITPGNAARIAVLPLDTAMYVGRTYTLRGGVTDINGNVRTDPVTWAASGAGIAVSSAGVVSANSIGRYKITGTTPSFTDSGFVSVVPTGRLTAWRQSGSGGNIISVDLDGANYTVHAPVTDGGVGAQPVWMPGTQKIVYTFFNGTIQVLRTVDQTGVVAPFFASPPATMSHQAEPSMSADGQWLYFSAFDTQCGTAEVYCLYRAKADATAPQVLGTVVGTNAVSRRPAASPDGSKVAFMSVVSFQLRVRVLDAGTQTLSTWSVRGDWPAWSPDGTTIAFLQDNRIKLVNPDGTNERFLTPASRPYVEHPMAWSVNSQWILARSESNLLELVEVATGNALPLPYSGPYRVGGLK